MKILVLSSHTPSLFWFRLDMMRSFISKGHEVIAMGPEDEGKWKFKFKECGIAYVSIPVSRNGLNILSDIKTYLSLRRIITKERPHKIFTYQAKTIVYGALASKAIKGVEVYPLVAGLGSIFRGSGLKNMIIRAILSFQYRIAFNIAKSVIFQNQDDKNVLVERGLLSDKKTRIINGSGVNTARFSFTPFPQQKAILYIGRLIGDKGINEYLSLCKRLKAKHSSLKCMVVGPYDTNPSAIKPETLQPFISEGIIEYYGEQKDVRPFLKECSVYVLPSYHEGTPKTVLEAMSIGRPIVTSDAPGCRETVIDGTNGYLIPIKNVDALENAVEKILNNPNLAKEFGLKSRRMAEDKYDVNIINNEINRIMEL